MALLDEAERARLEQIVPELEKAVEAGIGGQSMVGILLGMKGRLENLDDELGLTAEGRKVRRERAATAEMIAIHSASESILSPQAQTQFDGFLNNGFRSRKELETLSLFLSENSDDLNLGQRVQIVDEVLNGVQRRDYEIGEIPDKVLNEVRTVLRDPEINASVTAKLSAEKSAMLNAALIADDLNKIRAILKDEEVFDATHEHVSRARERYEAQTKNIEPSIAAQSEVPTGDDAAKNGDLLASLESEFLDSPVNPTDVHSVEKPPLARS